MCIHLDVQRGDLGHVEVGDYAILGGFTSVHQFSRIGTRAFCGLGSVVTQDIPPFATAAGRLERASERSG